MPMSTKEFRFWRDQMTFADRVWKDNGMIDEIRHDLSARNLMLAYRGKAWDAWGLGTWGGMVGEELIEDPTFFSNVNTIISMLFARAPRAEVVATNPDVKDNALRMQRLLNHVLRLPPLKIIENWNMTLLDASILKFGVTQYGYTPPDEKTDKEGNLIDFYDPAQPDFPWMRRRAPWDVRIDPLVSTFQSGQEARWCAFRDLMFVEQIAKHPKLIQRQDLQPTFDVNLRRIKEEQNLEESPEIGKLVEVWWLWDKEERKRFAISPGSDKPLMEPEDWPIPWKRLPYDVLQFNPAPDNAFGVSYGEITLPIQMEINKGMTMMTQLMKRLRRIIPISEDAMDDDQIQRITQDPDLAEFLFVKGPVSQAIGQTQLGGGVSELIGYIRELRDVQRIAMGSSEFDRGNRANVETATEAGAIAQGSGIQRARNQGPWEDYLANSIEMFAVATQFIISNGDRKRVVPILGDDDATELFAPDAEPFFEVKPNELDGTFIFRVRPGSTLPDDPNKDRRDEAAMTQLLSAPQMLPLVNWPQRVIDIVRSFDKQPGKQLTNAALQQAVQNIQKQRQAQGPLAPPPLQDSPQRGLDPALLSSLGGGGNA